MKCILYHRLDVRNRIAEEVMKAASIPVLRISQATVTQHDTHLDEYDIRGHKHLDCTHYCSNAAIFKHWGNVLFDALPILLPGIGNASVSNAIAESGSSTQPAVTDNESEQKKKHVVSSEKLDLFENITKDFKRQYDVNSEKHKHLVIDGKLSGIYLTTGKDLEVFRESIKSALVHLVDVHTYFVICPRAKELQDKLQSITGIKRVKL